MTDKAAARIKRGQTSTQDDLLCASLSDPELCELLNDLDAKKRSSAARLLGSRKSWQAVPLLCERLKIETALYTRLAICTALGAVGEPAIPELIGLLGKIGNNQHHELPQNGFYKKSYPLLKIGVPALKPLEQVLLDGERASALEAVDAIGHIAFVEADLSSESALLAMVQKVQSDQVMLWKIVRAFQAFPTSRVRILLGSMICSHPRPELRWEAVRSLGQHGQPVSDEIRSHAQQDSSLEVREMARLFLNGSARR